MADLVPHPLVTRVGLDLAAKGSAQLATPAQVLLRQLRALSGQPVTYAMAVAVVVLLAIAMIGLLVRALATSEFTGALFLVGMAIWFAWTIGGFIKRNRPCRYSFDALPATLLP